VDKAEGLSFVNSRAHNLQQRRSLSSRACTAFGGESYHLFIFRARSMRGKESTVVTARLVCSQNKTIVHQHFTKTNRFALFFVFGPKLFFLHRSSRNSSTRKIRFICFCNTTTFEYSDNGIVAEIYLKGKGICNSALVLYPSLKMQL
jgi:hypothetical protein